MDKKDRNKWQDLFHDSIFEGNNRKLLEALKNGAVINNSQNAKNTLNCAIRSMMNCSVEKFNIIFIKKLFDLGAIVCSNKGKTNNTIAVILERREYCFNNVKHNKDINIITNNT